jgi:phosphoribosylformylglycinamidine synthase
MNVKPVFVLAGHGINCESETAYAYELAGLRAEIVPMNAIFRGDRRLSESSLVHIPGGFSFGDHLGAGLVLADRFRHGKLAGGSSIFDELTRFVEDGGHVVGICNGFQVLVRTGLLPDLAGTREPEAALLVNAGESFEDRWVHVRMSGIFAELGDIELPVRHGEGRMVFADAEHAARVAAASQIVMTYVNADGSTDPAYPANPNGSWLAAAGLADRTGRVLGFMPHPEAFLWPEHHPAWARQPRTRRPDGLRFFEVLASRVRAAQTGRAA